MTFGVFGVRDGFVEAGVVASGLLDGVLLLALHRARFSTQLLRAPYTGLATHIDSGQTSPSSCLECLSPCIMKGLLLTVHPFMNQPTSSNFPTPFSILLSSSLFLLLS